MGNGGATHKGREAPQSFKKLFLVSVYIKRIQKVNYCFFPVKNTSKLINQQLKNEVKIVNKQKKVSYCIFYYQNLKMWLK